MPGTFGHSQCPNPRALAALLAATRHEDGFVRFDATCVLGNTAGPEVLDALDALAADPTMPRERNRSTAWSVGESARKAAAKIRGRIAGVKGV